MEPFIVQNLADWIAALDSSEKVNFRGFDLNALFPLNRTPLCFSFLHAAARCWNPIMYVFSFGGQEMSPTIEEFQVLIEFRRDEEIMPQPRFGHAQALGRMCGLTMHDARSLAHNGGLDIPSLIRQFLDVGDREDRRWRVFRSSIRLIEVAQGLKEGKSCIGLALAETLMGLNAFHQRETTRFAESPLLLQFRCQFGHDQIGPEEGVEYPISFPIRGSHLARYLTAWRTRELLAPAPSFSFALSGECLAWLEDKAQTGPTLASEASTSTSGGCRST
ncbi:hypothetical protein ACSBR1_011938 [Camellia fascicularis]